MKNSKQNLKSKANKFSWKKKNLAYQGSTCKNSAFRSTKKQLVRSWSSGLINLFYRDTLQSLTLWTSHYATRFMWSDWTGKMGSSVMVIEKFTLIHRNSAQSSFHIEDFESLLWANEGWPIWGMIVSSPISDENYNDSKSSMWKRLWVFELLRCFIIVISERIECFIIEFACIASHVINLFHLTFVL